MKRQKAGQFALYTITKAERKIAHITMICHMNVDFELKSH